MFFYTSKKNTFRNFFKTHNWKYYGIVILLLAAVISAIIVVSKNGSQKKNDETDTSPYEEAETTALNGGILRGVYKITVNRATCQIAFYPYDNESSEFSDTADKYMKCGLKLSVDDGTYKASDFTKSVWGANEEGTYYRYVTDFGNGIAFHSACYSLINDKNSLISEDFNLIGSQKTTTNGITLTASDSRWIYENCSEACEIEIYSDKEEDYSDRISKIYNIPEGITWDPTDSGAENVWCPTAIGTYHCDAMIMLPIGTSQDVLYGYFYAEDIQGNDISSYAFIYGDYDLDKAGTYTIDFRLIDIYEGYISVPVILLITSEDDFNSESIISTTGEKDTTKASEKITKEDVIETTAIDATTQEVIETTDQPSEADETTVEIQTEPETNSEIIITEPETEPETESAETVTEPETIYEETQPEAVEE